MAPSSQVIATLEGDELADPDEFPFGRPSRRRPPRLFRDATIDPCGGEVVAVSTHLGTYGMGGPGFLGLQIDGGQPPGRRWLVLTLWGAAAWITLAGDLAEEGFHPRERGELAQSGRAFRRLADLVGSRVAAITCTDDLLVLDLARPDGRVLLEVRRDGRDAPPWSGDGRPRALLPDESLRDAVVVSESGYLWTDDGEGDAADDDTGDPDA